jgi:hypothetical protein
LPFAAVAQKDARKYKEESEALRKEIWAWNRPEFKVRTVPGQYSGFSSVVIARRTEITADSRKKVKSKGMGLGVYREMTVTEVVRELVRINDKSAVDDYSEISYTQMERQSGFIRNKTTTVYIGVRVIKPDGSTREINADDIVLTKDEKTSKEAKAAIPDLQVGDMVDYFIAKQTSMEQQGIPPYTFTLFDESPIMHYSILCDLGEKYAIEYRCYNGAPDFKHTKGEDGENLLEMVKENIPAYPGTSFWVSPYRQLPIIRMNIMVGYKGPFAGSMNTRTPGQIYKNQAVSEFIEDEMNAIALSKRNYLTAGYAVPLSDEADKYVKEVKKQKGSRPDSVAAAIYYAFRFDRVLDIIANRDLEYVKNYASGEFNPSRMLFSMSQMLWRYDVENNLVLLTSRYGPDMKSLMSKDDLGYMLMLPDAGGAILGMSDVFSPAFHIPYYYENTPDAIGLDTRGRSGLKPGNFVRSTKKVPGSSHEQNSRTEKLVISPSLGAGTLQVKRNSTLKGHYKVDVQKELILMEDYYEYERKFFGIEQSLVEKFEESKKTRKYADELRAAFAEARKGQKDAFVKEAKTWFETEISDFANPKIINPGVRHDNPDFVFSSEFSIPGLVKKAGNNFIIEVGKLQGSPLKIEDDQRQRTLDVYAPFARSIHYQITIEIPSGYTAEGIANLNKKVENETGSFTAEAITEGNTVKIKISKVYKNPSEPHTNWDKMLAFLDASVEWSSAKLLLKKQ